LTTGPALIPAPMALRCPRCGAEMVTFERSGIHVDQCRECRGIFLDRGELERLVDAESGGAGWAGPRMNPPEPIPLPRAADPRHKGRHGPDGRSRALPLDARGYLPEWFGD
jgi:Zn-finger nucleic acid-binding protein